VSYCEQGILNVIKLSRLSYILIKMSRSRLSPRHKMSHHYLSTPIITQAPYTSSASSGNSGYSCDSYYSQSDVSSNSNYSDSASLENKYNRVLPPPPQRRWSTNSNGMALSAKEISLIQSSFSSLRSELFVCPGLVTLYTQSHEQRDMNLVSRECLVPVLLLNMGGSRAREQRGVELVLADRRTGLAILRDKLDTLSDYRSEAGGESIHRWHYSRDHTVVLGLVWRSAHLAKQFLHRVQELMDHPENVGLSGPAKTKSKKTKNWKQRRRIADKCDISSPCGFQHHVSLSLEEWGQMTTLQ